MKNEDRKTKEPKFSEEVRLEALRLHSDEGLGHSAICRKLGVPRTTVRRWLGPTGRTAKFPDAMRTEAARLKSEEGLSHASIARRLGVSDSLIHTWLGNTGKRNVQSIRLAPLKPRAIEMAKTGMSRASIARELNLSSRTVRNWVKEFRAGPVKSKTRYSEALKQQAVKLVESGVSPGDVALELAVTASAVRDWFRKALEAGLVKKPSPAVAKRGDLEFTWITREYRSYEAWKEPMAEWVKGKRRNLGALLEALGLFVTHYLSAQHLPEHPQELLRRGITLPDFYKTVCATKSKGVSFNNIVYDFLQWLLLRDLSERADDGSPVISPAYRNPLDRLSTNGLPPRQESDKSPLPYGYVALARQMLAEGPHFRDWTWAQQAGGAKDGHGATDWFAVSETLIDRTDPDCVWRLREFLEPGRPPILEMWSPVRWVALLIKLQLPARTFQIRMLDSGESDTFRYASGNWAKNEAKLAQGTNKTPRQLGVFRRVEGAIGPDAAVLYFNTNKTQDALKTGTGKGYEVPWPDMRDQDLDNRPYYWLEKLRNWQEKYNPISRPTPWLSIPISVLEVPKTEVQLAGYPDTCFLFRAPENGRLNRAHLPIGKELVRAWYKLLAELEDRLAAGNLRHQDGSRIRLVSPNSTTHTNFPLHSLRVSLITSLAIEGGIPLELLVKIVGHSRLIMTLYYTKPGHKHIRDMLVGAAERLEASKEKSIIGWLANAHRDELVNRVVFNNNEDFAALMPEHPANRNPVGWTVMHHGVCLAGGNNATELEANYALKGCHNGGPLIPSKGQSTYGPVPGGARNCVRCRWFVTEPHYVPALGAHLGNLLYHLCEVRASTIKHEQALATLKNEKYDAEKAGLPFMRMDELKKIERLYESAMASVVNLAKDTTACYQLIERCNALPTSASNGTTALVAVGDGMDVHAIIEETDSELLQLAGVCQNVEIYPDLNPGKAVFRQSQLLDSLLMREGMVPFFIALNEEEQLRYGNAFMRKLAQEVDSTNPMIGFRKVCGLIDSGRSLAEFLGVNVQELLPVESHAQTKVIPIRMRKRGG